MIDYAIELRGYLDGQGRVIRYPSRRKPGRLRTLILNYLLSKFDPIHLYTEKEVNALLNEYHTFGDPALLRRELFDRGLLDRIPNGSAYWCKMPQHGDRAMLP
jgi:hypothetical protein